MNQIYGGGKYSWTSDFDFDHEEYYWANKLRVDEKGIAYYSWKITYTFYKEPQKTTATQ
jgi:hypothetical protein